MACLDSVNNFPRCAWAPMHPSAGREDVNLDWSYWFHTSRPMVSPDHSGCSMDGQISKNLRRRNWLRDLTKCQSCRQWPVPVLTKPTQIFVLCTFISAFFYRFLCQANELACVQMASPKLCNRCIHWNSEACFIGLVTCTSMNRKTYQAH